MMFAASSDETIIPFLTCLMRQAGKLIVSYGDRAMSIEEKSTANYVTEVDLAVQSFVLEALKNETPAFAVLAEESRKFPSNMDQPTWILDPVDGTTNLMRHYGHSAVSLALAEQGTVTLGMVYNPYTDELFSAVLGKGACLNETPIHVSDYIHLKDCLVGFGTTPYSRKNAGVTFRIAEQVFLESLEIRRSGSAALDLVFIACGRLDGFFEYELQPWDYAAGMLILKEAGGMTTNWQGQSPSLKHSDSIIASNSRVHDALLQVIGANG
jgi:myo-inositol-1(or 4)-monophosphatase